MIVIGAPAIFVIIVVVVHLPFPIASRPCAKGPLPCRTSYHQHQHQHQHHSHKYTKGTRGCCPICCLRSRPFCRIGPSGESMLSLCAYRAMTRMDWRRQNRNSRSLSSPQHLFQTDTSCLIVPLPLSHTHTHIDGICSIPPFIYTTGPWTFCSSCRDCSP